MRKSLIAVALLAAFGAAQAEIAGDSTDWGIVQPGESVVNGGPHTAGHPGIGVDGSGNDVIDLAGIGPFSYKDSLTTSSGIAFDRFYFPGYTHSDPDGGIISTNLNWFQVPTGSQEVYFGIATNPGSSHQHAGFYVGDKTGTVVPTATTNYAAVGYLATPDLDSSSLIVLTGDLQYSSGTVKSIGNHLQGNGYTLEVGNITPGVLLNDVSNLGTSSVTNPNTGFSGTGKAAGDLFGSGNGSAVAGVAKGTDGDAYVASFGGIKN